MKAAVQEGETSFTQINTLRFNKHAKNSLNSAAVVQISANQNDFSVYKETDIFR